MFLTSFIVKVNKWKRKNVKFNMKQGEANKKNKEVNVLLVQIFEVAFE